MQKYTVKYRGNPKLFANLKKLETVQPRLVKRLRAFIKKGGSGFHWTLEDTASGSWIHGLTEEPFFEHATAPYAAEIRHQGYPITYFMGRGSRRYLKQAMEAAPADTKYYVFVETRLEPVIDTLCALDFEDAFFEKKAVLFLVDEKEGSVQDIEEFFFKRGSYIGGFFNVIVHRALYERYADAYKKQLQEIIHLVEFRTKLLGNSAEDTMWGFRQAVLNTAWMIEGAKLQSLRKLLSGRPFVVVAAGPSLDKNLHLLKGMEDRVVIVAVETVLRKLLHQGIRPHFVTALERVFEVYDKHLVDVVDDYWDDLRDVVMVSQSVCVNLVAGRWPGPAAVVGKKSLEVDKEFLEKPMNVPLIESGGSAAHMCLGIADFFEASSVALIGQDLAYGDDGRTHANDTAWESGGAEKKMDTISVPGWGGGEVLTNRTWKFFIDGYNEILHRVKMPVFDCTEGGALIERTRTSLFSEWLEKYASVDPLCQTARKIGETIRTDHYTTSPAKAKEQLSFFKDKFEESAKHMRRAFEALSSIREGVSNEANLPHAQEMQNALNLVHWGNALLQLAGQGPYAMLRSEWHIVRDMENAEDLCEWKEKHTDFFKTQEIACNFHLYWLRYMLRTLELMEDGGILPELGSTGRISADEGMDLVEKIIINKDRYESELDWDICLDNAYARCGKLSSAWDPFVFRVFAQHFQRSGRMTEAQSLMTLAVRFMQGRPLSRESAFDLLYDWSSLLSFADLCKPPYIKKAYEALKDAGEYADDHASLNGLIERLLDIRKKELDEAWQYSTYDHGHPLMVELAGWLAEIEDLKRKLNEGADLLREHATTMDKIFGILVPQAHLPTGTQPPAERLLV